MSQTWSERPDDQRGTEELTESERHRLLASTRRREVLTALAERAGPVHLEDLVDALGPGPGGEADASTAEQVRVDLHHCHLPKLDDAGVVEYDSDEKRVTPLLPPATLLG